MVCLLPHLRAGEGCLRWLVEAWRPHRGEVNKRGGFKPAHDILDITTETQGLTRRVYNARHDGIGFTVVPTCSGELPRRAVCGNRLQRGGPPPGVMAP